MLDCEQFGGPIFGGCRLPNLKNSIPTTMSPMKSLSILGFTALATAGLALGQAVTTPVGYVTIECKASSDTIVGVPMRQYSAYAGTLDGAPVVSNGLATLTLSGAPELAADAFANTHYVKFKNTLPTPAAGDGQWFVITTNTADTLTVDLNGATIDAVSGAALEVLKFWTLNELFNPADSTTDAATTKNAIVASTSQLTTGRRTQILIPNYTAAGTNASASSIFYVNAGIWKQSGMGSADYGSFQLLPDSYFIIRNPSQVTGSTFYTSTGEVESGCMGLFLSTLASASQDNYVSLPRPVDVKLRDLNLGGTSSFMPSTGTLTTQRRDQLFVYNNAATGFNKSASAIYYYHDNMWKKSGQGNTDFGDDVIPAGSGFVIRKYKSGNGASVSWLNTSSY